jgi:hypothetical protein
MAGYSNIKPVNRPLGIPARLLQSAKGGYGLGRPIKPPPVSLSLSEAVRSRPTGAATTTEPTPPGLTPKSAALTASSRGQLDITGLLAALQAPAARSPQMQTMGQGGPAGGSQGASGANIGHISAPSGSAAHLIVQYARQLGVDPAAALAVASAEGGTSFGAVGDQGTSYGPFQLHVGGALPRGKTAAWANSPAGLLYALRQIAGVSRGLTGQAAVSNIVRRFERPAAPGPEIQRAMAAYGRYRR